MIHRLTVTVADEDGRVISCRSIHKHLDTEPDGMVAYKLDDGSCVRHDPATGKLGLARLMLDTIRMEEEE